MRPGSQRERRVLRGTAMAVLVIAAAAFARPLGPQPAIALGASDLPRVIEGGPFEASGVAHVRDTNSVLFVDDGRTGEVFWMELTPGGGQKGPVVGVSLAADITDLEGITSDGSSFYVVGSQSKRTGFDGDGLVRFRFDAQHRRAENVERIQGLKAWLAANVPELRGTERQIGDRVLNIEAVAWDPRGQRLLLGLRAPVVDGQALVIPVRLRDPAGPFSRDNLRVDGDTIRLALDGAGIRSLEYDDRARAFRLITGAGLNRENRDFRIVEWDGDQRSSSLRPVATFPRALKPEGITLATLDGQQMSVVVFDTGRFVLLH